MRLVGKTRLAQHSDFPEMVFRNGKCIVFPPVGPLTGLKVSNGRWSDSILQRGPLKSSHEPMSRNPITACSALGKLGRLLEHGPQEGSSHGTMDGGRHSTRSSGVFSSCPGLSTGIGQRCVRAPAFRGTPQKETSGKGRRRAHASETELAETSSFLRGGGFPE